MRLLASLVSLVLCASCSRGTPTEAAGGAPALAASSAAPAASRPQPPSPEDEARQVVVAWSEALDRHDLAALERLYEPRVNFYGKELPRSTVIDIKKRALGPSSAFRQSIVGPIAVAQEGNAFAASFVKRSGSSSTKDVNAKLVVVGRHVREESDEPSVGRAAEACRSAAAQAVRASPAVKKILAEVEKGVAQAKDGRRMGVLEYPEEADGTLSESIGVNHADRFENVVLYSVDRAGKLTITGLLEGEDPKVPAAALAAVERACKRGP